MYIKTGNKTHPCLAYHPSKDSVSFVLVEPPTEALGTIVELCADNGFVMRTHKVDYWARVERSGNTLTLTNLPLPEPAPVPEPVEPTVNPQDDTDAMLVDHELRLTMLELGGM